MQVRVQFKPIPLNIFTQERHYNAPSDDTGLSRNELVMRMQPDEAIYMKMNIKEPGLHMGVTEVRSSTSPSAGRLTGGAQLVPVRTYTYTAPAPRQPLAVSYPDAPLTMLVPQPASP